MDIDKWLKDNKELAPKMAEKVNWWLWEHGYESLIENDKLHVDSDEDYEKLINVIETSPEIVSLYWKKK